WAFVGSGAARPAYRLAQNVCRRGIAGLLLAHRLAGNLSSSRRASTRLQRGTSLHSRGPVNLRQRAVASTARIAGLPADLGDPAGAFYRRPHLVALHVMA